MGEALGADVSASPDYKQQQDTNGRALGSFFPLKKHSEFQRNLPGKGLFESSTDGATNQLINNHLCKWCLGVGRGQRRKGRAVFSLVLLSVLHMPGSGGVALILTPWSLPSAVPGALGEGPKDPQVDLALWCPALLWI